MIEGNPEMMPNKPHYFEDKAVRLTDSLPILHFTQALEPRPLLDDDADFTTNFATKFLDIPITWLY